MRTGYGLAHGLRTVDHQAVGERVGPQGRGTGREARPAPATLVAMTTTERHDRWCGSADPDAFARWVADRSAGCGPHLVPVVRVGRCPHGHPAAEVLRPAVRALDETLDVVGVPTEGVAVTLTVPLLQLAARARAGALELGALTVDGVGVDDAGSVLVADRPPGAGPVCPDPTAPATPAVEPPPAPRLVRRPGTRLAREPGSHVDRAEGAVRTRAAEDGSRQLVLAARSVWDRVDPRAPSRATLDPALDAAADGDAARVLETLELVCAAAPPRPVRWTRPLSELFDDPDVPRHAPELPRSDPGALLVALARQVLEEGIPLGPGRRVALRHAVVGGVVAVGLVTAAFSVL